MNFTQHFTFIAICCLSISYVVEGGVPIMSKKYIGDNDTFTMTCNASSFFNPPIYDWYNVTRYKMYRKLQSNDKEELLGVIEALHPKSENPLIQKIPAGRQWEYQYGGLYTHNMFITLIVNDASQADVGRYWCEAEIYGTEDIYNSTLFNLRPIGEKPVQIFNKEEIGNNDTFRVICNNKSFRDSNLPKWDTVTKLFIFRQVEGGTEEELLGMLESFLPPGSNKHIVKKTPEGRNWEYSAGGYDTTENRDTIFITLTVKDGTCKDAGYYWCAMNIARMGNRYYSPKFQLQAKVTTVVKMDPINVTPQRSGSFNTSHNFDGDYVTMTCTYTGWRRMIAVWSLNRIYQQHNLFTKDFPPELITGPDGCPAYSHKSTKKVTLDRSLDDPIFFCRAVSTRGGYVRVFASMQIFTTSIKDKFAPSRSQAWAANFESMAYYTFKWFVSMICSCFLL